MIMAVDYWVLVPKASEQNVSGTVPDAFVVTVNQGSALDNQLLSNFSGQVTVGGKTGFLRAGPFTTMDAVNAYLKVGAQNAGTQIPGVDITPGGGLAPANPLSGITGVADSIAKLAGTVKGIFDALSDWKMWASIGWILLGALLVGFALFKLTHASQIIERGAGEFAKGLVA